MKKVSIFISAAIIMTAFSKCAENKTTSKDDIDNLSAYVDSVTSLQPVYTETQWAVINEGYHARVVKVERITADLDEADKTKIKTSKEKYETLKSRYRSSIKDANDAARARQDMRDALFGSGKIGADGQWGFVTAANVVSVYEDFVNTVRDKGDNYSDAQWIEVKALWKGLNDRKDAIENDISAKDKAKIVGIKIAYAAIKSVNRPISNIKEEIKENKKENK